MGITVQQAITYAFNAGFRGEQIVTMVSISMCECGSQACGCNYDCCPPSQSCGVLQIFQAAHPGTAACAVDPACAYTLGWAISGHGTNWRPWTTYNNGCYLSHTATVRAALAAMGGGGGPPPPPCGGACTGGATCVNNRCLCPAGTGWNGQACVPLGGGHQCPPGTGWNGQACAPVAQPGGSSSSLFPILLLLGAAGLGYYEAQRHREATSHLLHDTVPFGGRHDHLTLPALRSGGRVVDRAARRPVVSAGFGG